MLRPSQHTVLRWTHRSRFQVRPGQPIPHSDSLVVNAKWAGAVVIEAEGTNEGLADLLGRCGDTVTASLNIAGSLSSKLGKGDAGRVFRLLRDRRYVFLLWFVPVCSN